MLKLPIGLGAQVRMRGERKVGEARTATAMMNKAGRVVVMYSVLWLDGRETMHKPEELEEA